MDFEQTFTLPEQKLKNNKYFMQNSKKITKPEPNHWNSKTFKNSKDLYRTSDEFSPSYDALTEITEKDNYNAISEQNQEEDFYEINLTENNQKNAYSSSSLESIDINSDSHSEKSDKSHGSNSSYEKLKTDEYGFIINDVFHKRTYNLDSQGNTKKKESSWINLFKNFSLTSWDNSKPKIVSESSCSICDKSSELEKYCCDGIPQSFRGYVWSTLAETEKIKKKNLFDELCNSDPLPIDEIILKDITRCYPDHIMFNNNNYYGQHNLYNVLKAYSRYNPSIGYCQGMGFLAGILLMFIPAEDAFWLLVSTIENYSITGYYSQNLDKLKSDNDVFTKILKQKLPQLYDHLMDLEIDTILFTTEWFLCLYSKTLPWPCLLRVWDLFYYYGKSIIIKAGIALLQYIEKPLLSRCKNLSKDESLNVTLDIILHIHDVLYTDKYCQCFGHKKSLEDEVKIFDQQLPSTLKSLDTKEEKEEKNKLKDELNDPNVTEFNETENPLTEPELILPPPPLIHNREHRYKKHASNYNSYNNNNNNNNNSNSLSTNSFNSHATSDQNNDKCSADCLCIKCFDIDTFLNTILNIKITQKFEDILNE